MNKISKTSTPVQTSDTAAPTGVTSAEKETSPIEKYADDPGVRSVFECGLWIRPEEQAARYAAVLEDLDAMGWRAQPFLEDMPSDHARNEADKCLPTDVWPRRDDAQSLADALRDFCHSGAAGRIFGEGLPTVMLRNPRIGFVPFSRVTAEDEEGAYGPRYECSLTGESFRLPLGAPVPALLCDAYELGGEVNADEEHPGDRNPDVSVIHPSLLMAGPAFVLWAVWSRIRDLLTFTTIENHNPGERFGLAVELLTIVAGAGPENVGVEDPGGAYRGWERSEKTGTYDPRATGWERVRRHACRVEG